MEDNNKDKEDKGSTQRDLSEQRIGELESHITDLRVNQGKVEVELAIATAAINALTKSVQELNLTMGRQQGERTGAKAILGFIGAAVGSVLTVIIEWYTNHR